MTCKYIRALMEAIPIEELEPEEYSRVKRHTAECAGCRSVLLAAHDLDFELRSLPNPGVPSGLAKRIMARAARMDDELAAAAGSRSREAASTAGKRTRGKVLVWSSMLGGAILSFGAFLKLFPPRTIPLGSISVGVGKWEGLLEAPHSTAAVGILALGLCFYIAGFFAALLKEDVEIRSKAAGRRFNQME